MKTGMVLPERFELSASPLPRECSTPELRQHRRPAIAGIDDQPGQRKRLATVVDAGFRACAFHSKTTTRMVNSPLTSAVQGRVGIALRRQLAHKLSS